MRAFSPPDAQNVTVLLSSGTEDYFQSGWYFSKYSLWYFDNPWYQVNSNNVTSDGGAFHFPGAGLTHNQGYNLAAYKFHVEDPIFFNYKGNIFTRKRKMKVYTLIVSSSLSHHRVKNLLEKRRYIYAWYGKMHWWQWHSCRRPPSFNCHHLCTGLHLSPHHLVTLNWIFFFVTHHRFGLMNGNYRLRFMQVSNRRVLLSCNGWRRRRRTGKHWVSSVCVASNFTWKKKQIVIFLQKKP